MRKRNQTKQIHIKDITIGGQDKVLIQSMCNIKTENVSEVIKQINDCAKLGADLMRVSVMDEKDAYVIKEIKKGISIPLVADIHFDYRLALIAMDMGVDKVRINPGNIGSIDKIKLGGADDVARKNIKAKLDFVHKRINNIEISKRNQASEEANNYNTAISQQQLAKSSAENLVISLEAKQKSLDFKTIDRLCKINRPYEEFIKLVVNVVNANKDFIKAVKNELQDFCDKLPFKDKDDNGITKYCIEHNIPYSEENEC